MYYLSSTVFSEKLATRSHNDPIHATNFSEDILLLINFSFNFKYSRIVKLSCIGVNIDPYFVIPSINQFNKSFRVFFPSKIQNNNN